MTYKLHDKTILVTGATSGIGEQLCVDLVKKGNRVLACGRNQDKLSALASRVGEGLTTYAFDTARKEDVFETFNSIASAHQVDCLILNAGNCEYVEIDEFDSTLFERVIQTNFLGTVYCIEAGLPLLKKSSSPYLVLMGSSSVYFPFARAEAYGASKAALDYLAKSLRVDLEKFRISVSIIHPGFVKTPLTDKNDFTMPMVIATDAASSYIIRGLEKQEFTIHFPKRFTRILKFLGSLPERLQHKLSKKMVRT